MEKREEIITVLENMSNSQYEDICHAYYDETSDGVEFYSMSDFDDEFRHTAASDIARMVTNGSYDDCDDYFTYDDYSLETFNDLCDHFDYDDIADYCTDNDNDLGDCDIRAILDKVDTNLEITVHVGDEVKTMTLEEFKENYTDDIFKFEGSYVLYSHAEVVEKLEEEDNNVFEFWVFDFMKELERKGKRINIVGYEGYVFGDDNSLDEGRHFLWFYEPTKELLMKLVYNAVPSQYYGDTEYLENPRYIVPVKDFGTMKLYELVERL